MFASSKKGSTSRLSPLAPPFTTSRSNSNLLSPSASALGQSFSHLGLEGDSMSVSPFGYCDAAAAAHSPNSEANSYFSQYPSGTFQVLNDFDATLENSENVNGEKQGMRVDRPRILSRNDKKVAVSMPCDTFPKQGEFPAEGLNACGETSDSLCIKYFGISGKDDVVIPKDSCQVDACASFPTPRFPTSLLQDHFSMLTYPAQAMTWSSSVASTAAYDRGFSQQHDPYAAKLQVSYSLESNSLPDLFSEPSGIVTSISPLNHVLPENADAEGHGAVSSNNAFGYSPASIKEPDFLLNTKNKEIFCNETWMDESKNGKNGKPVTHDVMDPLLMAKPKLQIACSSVPHDLAGKLHVAEEGYPLENASKMSDNSDSDLDSPCWKGTLAANQSTFGVSGLGNSHLKIGQESCSSLNPLAPIFFPTNDKQCASQCGDECNRGDSFSFQKTAISAINSQFREQGLGNYVTAESSSEPCNILGTRNSIYMCVPEKEYTLLNNSSSSSMCSSSCMAQPLLVEDNFVSNSKPLNEPDAGVSLKGVKDAVVHNCSSTALLFGCENVFHSPSHRVDVPDVTKRHGSATKSLSTPPRLDTQTLVNTMNELSELLVRNCSNNLDSLNEHEHDIIKRIINNLSVCMRNRIGKGTLMPESSRSYGSYYFQKSADPCKGSNLELQSPKTKAMIVSRKLGYQNGHERQNAYATSFSEGVLHSFATSSVEGIKKGECTTQVIERALKEQNQTEEVVNPQVLLHRNLWLEAEGALCSMKYNAHFLSMKTEMERCQSDKRFD